jgi:hypothetical protein
MCGVSNLWGNLSYVTPIMVSCPIKTPLQSMWCRRLKDEPDTPSTVSFLGSTSVKRIRIVSRHDLAEEASDDDWLRTCKKSSCWFRRIRSRQQCLNCAQFGSSQFILTVRSTSSLRSPVGLHVVCASEQCIIHYLHAETVLNKRTLMRHPGRWSQRDCICNSRFLLKNQRQMNWMVIKIT